MTRILLIVVCVLFAVPAFAGDTVRVINQDGTVDRYEVYQHGKNSATVYQTNSRTGTTRTRVTHSPDTNPYSYMEQRPDSDYLPFASE